MGRIGTVFMIAAVTGAGAISCGGGDSTPAERQRWSFEEAPLQVDAKTVQLAVSAMMVDAGTPQLDGAYNAVDSESEVRGVTTGHGTYNLRDYLNATSYPLAQAYDIAQDGTVTVD